MPIAPIPPRKRKGKALSAADIAMQQAQQEEQAAPPARRRPEVRPTNRWAPLDAGDEGIVCRNCGGGLREHIGGWCQQPEGQQEEQQEEPIQQDAEELQQPETGPESQQQYRVEPMENPDAPQPVSLHSPEGILETAVRLAEMLPPCEERDILLRQCAALMSAVISNLFTR